MDPLISYWFFSFVRTGLPPLVLQRILEILTYLATNHSPVANMLFYFDPSNVSEALNAANMEKKKDKGKEKIEDVGSLNSLENIQDGDIPLRLFLKLLNQPLFLHSTTHLEQVEWTFFLVITILSWTCWLESGQPGCHNLYFSVQPKLRQPHDNILQLSFQEKQ